MESIVELLEVLLEYIVKIGSITLEAVGIFVMLNAAFHGFMRWLRHEEDGPKLEEGILSALEFMMCGEVLKTTTAKDMNDYIALGAIIILRFALAFEVQWEMKNKAWHEVHAKSMNNAEAEPKAGAKTSD